jgi:hypothetical protein
MMRASFLNPNSIGAIASAVCAVHCMVTPVLFVAQTCAVTGCCTSSSPDWWSALDYAFMGITFVAVAFSARNSSQNWMRISLYVSWGLLTLVIVNEKLEWIAVSELWKYAAAFILISLHLFNKKYCSCSDDTCEIDNHDFQSETK